MKIVVFASGSRGNATYLETKSAKLLIDIGVSLKYLKNESLERQINLDELDALLITHEHTDHISGLNTFLNKINLITYLSSGTYQKLHVRELINTSKIKLIKSLESFYIHNLKVTPIALYHDAVEPLGFVFEEEGKKFVYITDTGYIHKDYFPLISNATGYMVESNHDPSVLMMSNRTFALKQRILGDEGHLSNQDSAVTLAYVVGENTKTIIHAHISMECNIRELILETFKEVFNNFGMNYQMFEVVFAEQYQVSKVIEL